MSSDMSKNFAQNHVDSFALENILQKVLLRDQEIRDTYDSNNNAWEKSLLLTKMKAQDSINQSIVFPIIDKILDGEMTSLSERSWRTCFLVIQHSSLETQLKYMNFITDYFKRGYIQNYEYLIFFDRIQTRLNKAQIFGSQVLEFPSGQYLVLPVCPKPQRDSAFYSIGMDPAFFKVIDGSMHYSSSIKKDKIKDKGIQYDPVEIYPDEFAIMGLITSDKAKEHGIESVHIKINDSVVAVTDKNGFFIFKVLKNNIPDILLLNYERQDNIYHFDAAKIEGDFIMITYVIEN
jgi:hypothetical protein